MQTVLYKGCFNYDAVNVFVEQMALGLQQLDHQVTVLDWSNPAEHAAQRQRLLQIQPKLIVAFGSIVYDLNVEAQQSLYAKLNCCYAAVLVDHPLHHLNRLTPQWPRRLTTCCDRSHVEFLRQRLPDATTTLAFLPHGGCSCPEPPASERDLDIIFGGTFSPDAADFSTYFADCPASIRELLHYISETVCADDHADMVTVTVDVLAASGLSAADSQQVLNTLLLPLLPRLDNYIRTHRRLACLQQLDAAGIAVDIFGSNWPQGMFRKHRIHQPVPFQTMLQLMSRARIVLNPGPNFPDGSHERVFSAMVSGAVALTDSNLYWQQIDPEACVMACFRWTRLPELAATAAALLADHRRWRSIAAAGQQLALQQHCWQHRAAALVRFMPAVP